MKSNNSRRFYSNPLSLIPYTKYLFIIYLTCIYNPANSQSWQELDSLRNQYFSISDFENAYKVSKRALELVEEEFGTSDTLYADMLHGMYYALYYKGLVDECFLYGERELELRRRVQGNNHPKYYYIINDLAITYRQMSYYDKSLPLYLELIESTIENKGKQTLLYSSTINNLAVLYMYLGQYDRAMPLYLESIEITTIVVGKENPVYAYHLGNLAEQYRILGMYEEALPLYNEVLENIKMNHGEESLYYAISLNNLASLYRLKEDFDTALPIYLIVLEKIETFYGRNSLEYIIILNNLAELYLHTKQYEKSLNYFILAQEISEKSLGVGHSHKGLIHRHLGQLYSELQEHDKAVEHFQSAINNVISNIERTFSILSEKEKENFVETTKVVFNHFHKFFLDYHNDYSSVAACAYDVELATKSMILQSGIEMRQTIINSKNEKALQKYDEWFEVRQMLNKLLAKPVDNFIDEIEALGQKANQLESELTRLSSSFSSLKKMSDLNFKDVQRNLKPNEIAIEWAVYESKYKNDEQNNWYVAIINGYDFEYPIMIKMFEEKQAHKILGRHFKSNYQYINEIYGSMSEMTEQATMLYNLIWKPLEPFLQHVNTVFMSPSGLLHKINFAALRNEIGQFICDSYNVNIVTSTSLIEEKKSITIKSVALFGGVEYNNSIKGKGYWQYLPGTLAEINKIGSKLKESNIKVYYKTAKKATESAFKKIANEFDILHIATHGFFFPDPANTKIEESIIIQGEVEFRGSFDVNRGSRFFRNSNPLMRAGLVFSNANEKWFANEITDSDEDGVLTANEIILLDMHNTQLVVLSACETGLGDIRGSEGVYGLQRAFKMAGVKYLIMSLWQVPDKETVEFMEMLYGKLLNYNDIRNSFSETQREMRQKYDPFFWAAFVLVE